jgi:glycosyltransferase involved in cell wall biosynthesis
MPKIVFFITEDWAFLSHRLPLARAARDAGWTVVIATHVTTKADVILAEGFELEPIPLDRGGANPWRELKALIALIRVVLRHKPDILHCVAVKPVIYGNLAALLTRQKATVSALAGMGYAYTGGSPKVRLLRSVLSTALRLLLNRPRHHLIVQNEDDEALALSVGMASRETITLIPGSGVDLEALPALPPPDNEPPIFALVARMLADKGVREAVEAMTSVPGILWLVGAPDPHNPSSIDERELRAWEQSGKVKWLGHRNDVAEVWRQADVAVLPSYREGTPKALLEAAACARPIVTTDVTGCRQVIENGVEGYIVPARSPYGLADAMRQLAEDKELRHRMGAAARTRAEERFGQERVVEAHFDIYRALTGIS